MILLFAAAPQSQAQSHVQASVPLGITFEQFKSLAVELAPKVNLFRATWDADPKAEFFGGTTRDYLLWLRRKLRGSNGQSAEAIFAELRALQVIDSRELFRSESDLDVASDHPAEKFDFPAEEFNLSKLDVVTKERFAPGSPRYQDEILQGYLPAEKIRLGRNGFIASKDFGDGVREIFDGRVTAVFSSEAEFNSSHYAKLEVNHQVLLALRYLRLLSSNYFALYGEGPPHDSALFKLDTYSETETKRIISQASRNPKVLERFLAKPGFKKWINGTVRKSFTGFVNPSATKLLFEHFGADKLIALYGLEPINQYVFYKNHDLLKIAGHLKSMDVNESALFTPASEVFGPELFVYHGTESLESMRKLVFEGVLPTHGGNILARHPGGHGFYTVPKESLGSLKAFTSDRTNDDLIVRVKVSPRARVIDLRRPELHWLANRMPDDIADEFGADIIVREYENLKGATETAVEAVIKNAAVIENITAQNVVFKTASDILKSLAAVNSVDDFIRFIRTADQNRLLGQESTLLMNQISSEPRLRALLLASADRVQRDDELRGAFVRIVLEGLHGEDGLRTLISSKINILSRGMTADQWLQAVARKEFDQTSDKPRHEGDTSTANGRFQFNRYALYLENLVLPALLAMPADQIERYLKVSWVAFNLVGTKYSNGLIAAGATPLTNRYNHGDDASGGVKERFWNSVFKVVLIPLLKEGGPRRKAALALADWSLTYHSTDERLMQTMAKYAVATEDHEFIHRINLTSERSLSSMLPSHWLKRFAEFPLKLRLDSFADFIEATFTDRKREKFRSKPAEYIATYVFEYEFRRKNMPVEELKQIADRLAQKLHKKPSHGLIEAVALLRGELGLPQAVEMEPETSARSKSENKANHTERPLTCAELFAG